MQSRTIIIDSRFKGPPDSGNGGYTAGLLAKALNGDAKVTLRHPPPLDRELKLVTEGNLATLSDQDQVVANAQKVRLDIDVPDCPPIELVESVAANYVSAQEHILSTCFVCGPDREQGDGLNIFPVAINDYDCVASIWKPVDNLTASDGLVATEIVWAALDCPGYFAHRAPNKMMLLGSMTASVRRRPSANETLISMGWQTAVSGRKYFSGTALYDETGEVCAASQQVWIALEK